MLDEIRSREFVEAIRGRVEHLGIADEVGSNHMTLGRVRSSHAIPEQGHQRGGQGEKIDGVPDEQAGVELAESTRKSSTRYEVMNRPRSSRRSAREPSPPSSPLAAPSGPPAPRR